jgi:bacteriocin biosynthesis cyclodehydratase domain-containing protein
MEVKAGLLIHSAAEIVDLGAGRVQVRVPDGDHFTIETRGIELAQRLEAMRQGTLTLEAAVAAATNDDERHVWDRAGEVLRQRGLLRREDEDDPSADWLLASFDYVFRRTRAVRPPMAADAAQPVVVCGEGLIADVTRRCVTSLGRDLKPGAPAAEAPPGLRIACSDHDDHEFLLEQNEVALREGVMSTFARRSGSRVLVGPIVVPRESACFNCYLERVVSNTEFIDEFEGNARSSGARRPPLRDATGLMSGVLAFLVTQHVAFALERITTVARVGEVLAFDLLSSRTTRHPVLKLPRCRVCGRGRPGELLRAARDLL